jgi:pre-rRNA-processing protein TSR4
VKEDIKESSLESELKEFERIVESKKPQFQEDSSIDAVDSSVKEDKCFLKFKDTIQGYPEQVLRYKKGEDPLWVSDANMPSSIPNCELCGSKRRFEFQVSTFYVP